MLLGTLPHSGKVRGVLAEKMDQAHLIEAMDEVLRRLGGTARVWRTDRLATVIVPGTGDVQASFAPVAKHYGAVVEPCPPRRGNRKGAVESSVRFTSGRWWRTMSATNPEDAQRSLDVFCATTGDERERRGPGGERTTVGAAGRHRTAARPPVGPVPGHHRGRTRRGRQRHRRLLGQPLLGAARTGRHDAARPAPLERSDARRGGSLGSDPGHPSPRSGGIRAPWCAAVEHREALEAAVLDAFTTARPCDKKANRPPGREALEEAARLLGPIGREPVVDLSVYDERGGPSERVLDLSADPLAPGLPASRRCRRSAARRARPCPPRTSSGTPTSWLASSRSR